jgi:SNF2 family DNA or RNA helicase
MRTPPPLYDHQVRDVQFCLDNPRVFDSSDPGCGKTRVQIETFRIRRQRGGKCLLVICPKSLLRSAWENDFHKFAPEITVSVAPAAKREEAFQREADAYITNTDAVVWLAKQPPRFFAKFDTLVIDEITAFKHHTSQRSKALAKIRKHFINRAGLTGTPNSNTIADLWHPIFIIDDGKRLGTSFYQFRASVCSPKQVGPDPNMVKWEDRDGAELAVGGLLKDITIRNIFEQCHDIPENLQTVMPYQMSPKQRKAYDQMEKAAITLVNNNEVVSAINAAVVANKLLQIASGAVYGDEEEYSVVDLDRYELVAQLVQERTNPCVVFFNWRHQRDGLIEEFDRRGIIYTLVDGTTTDKNREEAVRLFQAGFYHVFLAHPASAAHGLTLTKATTTIWTSPVYNLEHFVQGNRRTYRAGQTQRTETITLLAEGTIETKVYEKMTAKNVRQLNMLSILKELS